MAAAFEQMEIPQVLDALHSSPTGLSTTQAELRLREHGPNHLVLTKRRSQLAMLLAQFTDPFALILLSAGTINSFLGVFPDNVVMFVIVGVNAIIGFLQEYKAERIMDSLKRMLAPRARVLRDGQEREVAAEELVPGDVAVLEEGDAVPADIRLAEQHELATNDFALTGEADPKKKFTHAMGQAVSLPDRDNEVFLGTTVARGNGRGVVISTGMGTEIGRIAQLSQQTAVDLSPLQLEMGLLARRLTWVTAGIALGLYALSLAVNLSWIERFVLAIGVAASCVPEGLPAQVSVALSLGVKRLAKRLALVKQLSAVETLGSTTVICTDKTGTLTAGQMTVEQLWTIDCSMDISGVGYDPRGGSIRSRGTPLPAAALERLLIAGPLASTADIRPPDAEHAGWYCLGDPTEGALITLALKQGVDVEGLRSSAVEERQFPFDSVRKRMSSVRRTPEGLTLLVKGNPDAVLALSTHVRGAGGSLPMTEQLISSLHSSVVAASREGLRVLALAERRLDAVPSSIDEAERDLTLLGFVAMSDPPREEVRAALEATRTAGIRTYVLTGDSAITAEAIAEKIGLSLPGHPPTIIEGADLLHRSDDALRATLREPVAIFCRVSPEDKLRIVELLKRHGDVVAVTGDGVNDAPALKSAAIGVAMGRSGTDVAKNAAEIVLLDDSFATLVDAVREGRTIYQNLRKTVLSSLTSNGGELFATLFGFCIMALGASMPIQAVQILAIDLLAEMAPLTLLTLDPAPPEIMRDHPRPRSQHLVSIPDLLRIMGWGALMGAIGVANYLLFLTLSGDGIGVGISEAQPLLYAQATTVTYLTIGFCQYANILSRRWRGTVFSRLTLENSSVLASMAVTMAAIAALTVSPLAPYLYMAALPSWAWVLALGGGMLYLTFWEFGKLLARRTAS